MSNYVAPAADPIAAFADATNGAWFGNYTDIYGNRAVFPTAFTPDRDEEHRP